jgi:hypothetical protein
VHQIGQSGDQLQLTSYKMQLSFLFLRFHLVKLLLGVDVISVTQKLIFFLEVVTQIILSSTELLRRYE